MKKIMILGATYTQVPLVNTAKRLGYYTIVASTAGDYPAFSCADEVCSVDISDRKAVLAKARELKIDGIATCCMDIGVRAVGYVCEQMGLCGLSEQAALLSNQKLLMKEAFVKGGVKSPDYCRVSSEEELQKAWESIPKPVILKAVDLQASRGIYVCSTFDELRDAYSHAMKLTREDFCIVEQFIAGIDIGAQAFVYNGEILFILPHNDEVFVGSANKPIGHSAPLMVSDEIMAATKKQCELAIRAIGLNNCAVNIDLILADDGQVYMVELTGRVGATCLPELVALYYGVDYYRMIVEMAMGNDPRPLFEARCANVTPNASRFLMAERAGVLKKVVNNNPASEDIALMDIYVKPGDKVKSFEDGADRIGQVVVTGTDPEICFKRLDEIAGKITLIYED